MIFLSISINANGPLRILLNDTRLKDIKVSGYFDITRGNIYCLLNINAYQRLSSLLLYIKDILKKNCIAVFFFTVNIYTKYRQGNKMKNLLDLWFLIKNNFSLSLNVFSFI